MTKNILLAATLSLSLAGCSAQIDQRGFDCANVNFDQIKVGKDNKISVREKIGSPSAASSFEQNAWYYISCSQKSQSFYRPEYNDKKVIAVVFDKNDVVKSIDKNYAKNAQAVKPNSRKTQTVGHDDSLMSEILGNFGNLHRKKAASTK